MDSGGVDLYSDEDPNYYNLSSDDEEILNTQNDTSLIEQKIDFLASLPNELFEIITKYLTIKQTLRLSITRKVYLYLGDEEANVWKRELPNRSHEDGMPDVHSIRILNSIPQKVKISLENISIIEGHKTKWMMYKYIKLKRKINDDTFDLKLLNKYLIDQKQSIDRIRCDKTKENLMKQYNYWCNYKTKHEAKLHKKTQNINISFRQLCVINTRLVNEWNDNWVNIKTRIIFQVLFNCFRYNRTILTDDYLKNQISIKSNGRFRSYGTGQRSNSLILIQSSKLNIHPNLIQKMKEHVLKQTQAGNECFEWRSNVANWAIKWVQHTPQQRVIKFIH